MWLLTAVGPVHGQHSFTFALEQKKEYTVGRDKNCEICYEHRYIKPIQGKVIVGDWDPTNPSIPPGVKWKSEPSKKGVYPAFKTLLPSGSHATGSRDRKEYEEVELVEGTQGVHLHENEGQGIELAEGCWFFLTWKSYQICYDKLKGEPDETRDRLRRLCISWTSTFETSPLPDVVLSQMFKNSMECNYAVCYGVRILLPSYLQAVLQRASASWKKVADSEDSFRIPDEGDPKYQPKIDPAVPSSRKDIESWLPDRRRQKIFDGCQILGLRGKISPVEKRYIHAMGGKVTDHEIVPKVPRTAAEFEKQVKNWLDEVNNTDPHSRCLVVYFTRVKEEVIKSGVDWQEVILKTCQKLGVVCTSGAICWGAVRHGGVTKYIEAVAGRAPPSAASAAGRPNAMPPPITRRASPPPPQSSALPSLPPSSMQSAQPDFIPSTYPDETARAPAQRSSAQNTQQSAEQESNSQPRKPLRHRAARKVDLFADLSYDGDQMPQPSPQAVREPEAARPVSESAKQGSQSIAADTQSSRPGTSRLKRRAGGETQTQTQFKFEPDDSSFYADQKKSQMEADIRELYEQTKAESAASFAPPQPKRRRVLARSADISDSESPLSMPSNGQTPVVGGDDDILMDDEEEQPELEEDPVQKMLRIGREAKAQKQTSKPVQPPSGQQKRTRLASEETEPVELPAKRVTIKPEPSPVKKKPTQPEKNDNQPDTDEAFLQSISRARKAQKEVDQLDKDFNNLRIPKPNTKAAKSQTMPPPLHDHPDWNLVEGFDDDLRGNFIQIVRTNLFRKDLGRIKTKEAVQDDGKPNFKKFKKKNIIRRNPINLVLSAPTLEDAEMGEPYWPTQAPKTSKRSQNSHFPATHRQDEDDMPLLPRTGRRRVLDEDEEEVSPAPSDEAGPSRSSKRNTATTQSQLNFSGAQRKTRAASVVSDASSVAASTRSSKAAKSKAAASVSKGRGKKKANLDVDVVQDSEDEVAMEMAKTPAPASGTRSATRATTTLDAPSKSTRSSGRTGRATQTTGTSGRRKLLVDDDDDDDDPTPRGLTKKRRMG